MKARNKKKRVLIISIVSICIIGLLLYLVVIKKKKEMKAYELGYKFDLFSPKKLNYYIAVKMPIFQLINQDKILIEIDYLLQSLQKDRIVTLEHVPVEYINIYFDGNTAEFYDSESSDFIVAERTLLRIKDEIKRGALLTESDVNYMLFQEYFIRKYCLYDFNYTWYITKRINFSYEFLAHGLPNFSDILYKEDYISTSNPFGRKEIIFPLIKKSYEKESLIDISDERHIYIANIDFIKTTLNELEHNENNCIKSSLGNEFAVSKLLLKNVINGDVLLILYK